MPRYYDADTYVGTLRFRHIYQHAEMSVHSTSGEKYADICQHIFSSTGKYAAIFQMPIYVTTF